MVEVYSVDYVNAALHCYQLSRAGYWVSGPGIPDQHHWEVNIMELSQHRTASHYPRYTLQSPPQAFYHHFTFINTHRLAMGTDSTEKWTAAVTWFLPSSEGNTMTICIHYTGDSVLEVFSFTLLVECEWVWVLSYPILPQKNTRVSIAFLHSLLWEGPG